MEKLTENSEQVRMCTRCETVKAIDRFPHRSHSPGRRHHWCRPCFNEHRRQLRRRNRQADARRFAGRLAQVTVDEQRVVELATRALKRFDGIPGLLAELKQLIEDARRAGDFRTAQMGLTSLINLALAAGRLESYQEVYE